jgi:hypothetical protein
MPEQKQKSLFPEMRDLDAEASARLVETARTWKETCDSIQAATRNLESLNLESFLRESRRASSMSRSIIEGMATLVTGPWVVSRGIDRWQKRLRTMRKCVSTGPLRDAMNLHRDAVQAVQHVVETTEGGESCRKEGKPDD